MNLFQENSQTEVALPDLDVLEHAHVLLYNDDWHTFDEVIDQLIIATGCSADAAESMAWTVHHKGVCKVFDGSLDKCLEVSAILQEIDLKTEIRF